MRPILSNLRAAFDSLTFQDIASLAALTAFGLAVAFNGEIVELIILSGRTGP